MAPPYIDFDPDWTVPPGEHLRDELRALRWSVKKFAAQADIPEATVRGILRASESITPLIAKKFERTLGSPAHLWLNMENGFREDVQRGKTVIDAAYWRAHARAEKAADRNGQVHRREKAAVAVA